MQMWVGKGSANLEKGDFIYPPLSECPAPYLLITSFQKLSIYNLIIPICFEIPRTTTCVNVEWLCQTNVDIVNRRLVFRGCVYPSQVCDDGYQNPGVCSVTKFIVKCSPLG